MRKSKSHTPQQLDAVKYGRVSSKEQEKEGSLFRLSLSCSISMPKLRG